MEFPRYKLAGFCSAIVLTLYQRKRMKNKGSNYEPREPKNGEIIIDKFTGHKYKYCASSKKYEPYTVDSNIIKPQNG
jgi:hypothetical protein